MDLRALQGCEARRSERQKIPPAVFGLVSARRKPGTMLHVQYPEVGAPAGEFYTFSISMQFGDANVHTDSPAWLRADGSLC